MWLRLDLSVFVGDRPRTTLFLKPIFCHGLTRRRRRWWVQREHQTMHARVHPHSTPCSNFALGREAASSCCCVVLLARIAHKTSAPHPPPFIYSSSSNGIFDKKNAGKIWKELKIMWWRESEHTWYYYSQACTCVRSGRIIIDALPSSSSSPTQTAFGRYPQGGSDVSRY